MELLTYKGQVLKAFEGSLTVVKFNYKKATGTACAKGFEVIYDFLAMK